MSQGDGQVQLAVVEDEMKRAYMAYAMSVIVGRAIPDVRDGLKPVHRRILYAMHTAGMRYNQPFKKSARIVGEVLGKYHPHGDSAIYDSLVRMVQSWSLRYPLIDGQGNFGSIDNDSPAAMRYTEARLKKISQDVLSDIEKDTVDFVDNFDGSEKEPESLPGALPNLLVNGSSGIAVGMATNMPPHNLREVCAAMKAFIDNPELSAQDLLEYVPGPDFPTGGVIYGTAGIIQAYANGKGRLRVRGVIEREEHKGRQRMIITEIPYQVVKSQVVEQIADLVRDKRIEGIADIRDESDRKGMRVVIELKRDANADIIENQLFKYTRLQVTFGIINLAIVNKRPRVLSLPQMLKAYLDHRTDVITRRTRYDLRKAEERAHILEGLLIALGDIDEVVALIKKSDDATKAREGLMDSYELSERQAIAILEMRLQRLTALETDSIKSEHAELLDTISDLQDILAKPGRVKDLIREDLDELEASYGDERRTRIVESAEEIDIEDLIEPEDMVVTISRRGYVKRLSIDTYQAQHRGGKGIIGAATREDDYIEHLFVANTHSTLLFFTNDGKVFWKKVYRIPETSRTARGSNIVNLLRLGENERISAVVRVDDFSKEDYLFFATRDGYVKKTALDAYSRPRKGGIWAIKLNEGDDLVRVVRTSGHDQLMLHSRNGQAIRFDESDVRPMGRYSQGVRGMRFKGDDAVVSLSKVQPGKALLTVTSGGYGKRTPLDQYPVQGRGGMGVRDLRTSKHGKVVATRMVSPVDELLLISQDGIIIRTPAREISTIGRSTHGVRVMKVRDGDSLSAIARIVTDAEDIDEEES